MISFVIPAYNEAELIDNCIISILDEARNVPHEIIVVDNASTDNTAEVAAMFGSIVRVIEEPVRGVTRARQAGFVASKYQLVAFIDADNELPPSWLTIAMVTLADPRVVAVSGPMVYYDLPRYQRIITALFYSLATLTSRVWPVSTGGNILLKRSALSGFNTKIDFFGDDTDTAIRLSEHGKVKFRSALFVWSSARRMKSDGLFVTGATYIINYLWVHWFGRPYSTWHTDIRPDRIKYL